MIFIVDGNSMMNTVFCASLYTASESDLSRPFYQVSGNYVIKDSAEKFYRESIIKYLVSSMYGMNNIEKVYFAIDSKSWRKAFYKKYANTFSSRPDYNVYQNGYKGQRKIDSPEKEQVLELIRYCSNNVIATLNKIPGFVSVSMKGLEGDDIVAHLTERFKDKEVVVWTNDSDMHQILRQNVYIVGPTDKKTMARKLFVSEDFNTQAPAQTTGKLNFQLLNEGNNAKNTITDLISVGHYTENKVNPVYEVLTKILCGDKQSDNIPAVFSYNKEGKVVNVTRARVSDKIYSDLKSSLGYTDSDIISKIDSIDAGFIDYVAEKICQIMSVDISNKDVISKGISFNIHIIRLCDNCIPSIFTEYVDTVVDSRINENFDINELKKYLE